MLPALLLPMLSDDVPQVHPHSIPAPPVQGMIPAMLLPMLSDDFSVLYPRTLPEELEVTVTPLFNRIAIQVTEVETILTGTTIEGHVDIRKNGVWHNGTELYRSYDTDDHYANCFNLTDNTSYKLRLTVRLRDTTTQEVIKQYVHHFVARTLSSATTQQTAGGLVWYVDPVVGQDGPGRGETPSTPYKWLNARDWAAGDTIVIMNGDFRAGTAAQQGLRDAVGSATNWIRVVPYSAVYTGTGPTPDPAAERLTREVALNGTWTDEGGGAFSMPLVHNTHFHQVSGAYLANIYDTTIERQLYPFKTKGAFDAATVGDGTGYSVVLSGSTPTYTATLYVRLASGANPGTSERLLGAYGNGLATRNLQYVVFDGLTFASCGTGTFLDSTETEVKFVAIRNCRFERNAIDVVVRSSANGIHHILIEDNVFIFDGAWPHFFEQFAYTEGDPYVQTASWSHVKSSAWESSSILLTVTRSLSTPNVNEAVVIRNNYCRGTQFVNPATGNARNAKHLHLHGNTIEECWDDAIGDIDQSSAGVNAAIHNEAVRDAATLISLSPYNSGPLWFFASTVDGYIHYPFKIGDQAESTEDSHGYKIIANVSGVAKGFGHPIDDASVGACQLNGGHSGVRAANVVLKEYQSGIGLWMQQSQATNYTVKSDRRNEWRNALFYMVNKDTPTPAVPQVRWANPVGAGEVDYENFATASAALAATDTSFPDCIGTYSAGGGVDPFPTGIAGGLNPLITQKSVYVRGITDLAGDEFGNAVALEDLSIGYFPLRAAE